MVIKRKFTILLFTLNLYIYPSKEKHDTKNVCISTVAWRENSLIKVITSILPQADRIFVFLQFYDHIPEILNHKKITVIKGSDYPEAFALGSSAKFFWADKVEGYYITIDDDINYPVNYVDYCIRKIELYKRKYVIGFHGTLFKARPFDYFKNRSCFWYIRELKNDTPVHMLGTGVMAYHTDTIKISMNSFKTRNQDDVWFALAAQKNQVGMMCVSRPSKYITVIEESAYGSSSISSADPNHQIRLASQYPNWKIYAKR